MNVVLLSGGSGKRLWPLSNETLSKQFLRLLKNDDSELESMVQRVVRQMKSVYKDINLYVSCNQAQNDILQKQLGYIETILEPSRRDTFPAIVLAAAYLRYEKQMDEDEVFLTCPIDPYADIKYFRLLSDVYGLVEKGVSNIGLLGALPTFPTAKYGYIIQNNGIVTGFVEKPSEDKAEKLIIKGALWNCGVFALRIGYVLEHARKYIDFDSFGSLYNQYNKLPQISFDYEVVEKETSISVAVYDGIWKDLGTWLTITDEMQTHTLGNVVMSDLCENTHALNMLNIPMIVHDTQDAVVVACHDGIMVTGKAKSATLKPLTDQITQRPMYEQRRWGDYRVLDSKQIASVSSLIKRMHVNAGQSLSYQYHNSRSEVWVIVSGEGILTINGVESAVVPGSVINIPKLTKHKIFAKTELEFIEVQLGEGALEEEDIVRIETP